MKKMKLFTAVALVLTLSIGGLTACSNNTKSTDTAGETTTPAPTAAEQTESTGEAVTNDAASNDTGAEDLIHVRFSAFNGITSAGFRFGVEKGIFKDNGVDIELVEVEDKIAALASGATDIADLNTSQAIVAAHSGAEFKMVSSMFRTKGAFHLIADPSIESIADLKGKKIGIAVQGSGLEITVLEILEQNGISRDDVTLIANGAYQQAYASLVSKQVDATIIHEPFVTIGEKEGTAKLLALGWDYLPNFHTGVIVASDKLIAENPEAVRRTLKGYFESFQYAKEHRDEFIKWATNYLNLDEDVVTQAFDREEVIWENNPVIDVDSIKETQEVQKKWGFQDEIYEVSDYIDLSFIPED